MDSDADKSYRLKVIGMYQQAADREIQSARVAAGSYPVVGSIANNTGRISEGGVVFDAVDLGTNEPATVIAFHSSEQLRALERNGQLELVDGIDHDIFEDRKLVQASRRGLHR